MDKTIDLVVLDSSCNKIFTFKHSGNQYTMNNKPINKSKYQFEIDFYKGSGDCKILFKR